MSESKMTQQIQMHGFIHCKCRLKLYCIFSIQVHTLYSEVLSVFFLKHIYLIEN